jgi:hypothetical protein
MSLHHTCQSRRLVEICSDFFPFLADIVKTQVRTYIASRPIGESASHLGYKAWVKEQANAVSIRSADELLLYHSVEAELGIAASTKGR